MKTYAPTVLRIGISAVILWFGVQQIIDTNAWLPYLPSWTEGLFISQTTIIYLNGTFEILFGTFMLVGFYTRFVALILALHMFDVAYTVGYDAIGVRDLGIALSTFVIFLYGSDWFSTDTFFDKRV